MFSVIETSSTAELVYDFITSCGDEVLIDHDIAACIYAGIITDTGSFSYSCNYEKTYLVTADLFRKGIDGEHIHRLVYDTYSEERLRLLGYSISEKLVVLREFNTAYIYLSKDDLDRFNYQIGDTEDVVNYALSIDGINLAALFSERNGIVRVSLRSKGNFPVNDIARKYFNGGGHINAAGADSYSSLEETVRTFVEMLPEYKEKLELSILMPLVICIERYFVQGYTFVLLLVLCFGCSEPPQPSTSTRHLGMMSDSLLKYNRGVIRTEDQQIDDFVARYGWNMTKTGTGLRYLIFKKGHGVKAMKGKIAVISYTLRFLNGDSLLQFR